MAVWLATRYPYLLLRRAIRKEAGWPRLLRPLSGTEWREMYSNDKFSAGNNAV